MGSYRGSGHFWLAVGLAFLSGCRTQQLEPAEPFSAKLAQTENAPERQVVQQPLIDTAVQPASAMVPVEEPSPRTPQRQSLSGAEPIPVPPGMFAAPSSLTFFDALEMGLAQNPDLIALRTAEGVSEGMLGVAETYPFNPWVQIQATPYQKSSDPLITAAPVNHYVLLMQQLQLGHQRRHRADAAAATLNSVRWNYVQAKLTNAAQTQRLYFTALYQREIAELARANAELNTQLLAISRKQLEAGTITGADVAILKLDNSAAQRQAALAEANYRTALVDLKRQLGLSAATPVVLPGRLMDWQWQAITSEAPLWSQVACVELPATADRAWLARSLASGRPDVWAATADVDAARANLDLARANRIPDLQIGPYYQRNNDSVLFWGFRAQMDIPVLNTGLPMVRQRLAELTQRSTIWEQLLERATLEASAALDRYDRALSLVSDGEASVGEEIPAELQKLEEQFRAGEVDLVRVVTARTSLFQARRAALDTQNELAQAAANLTASTGLPPDALIARPVLPEP